MILAAALGALLLFGLLGMTVGPALVARAFSPRRKSLPATADSSLEILIPVHDQAEALRATLENLKREAPGLTIRVGANACKDNSASVARELGAQTVERESPGKWTMLRDLVAQSQTEWVGFLDAGTVLSEGFLRELDLANADGAIMAVAPRYAPSRAGLIHQLVWQVEATLKTLENSCGGPISIHGACIFYRTRLAREAFAALGDREFLNDDIALPLQLRLSHPAFRIEYRSETKVDDFGLQSLSPPRRRRTRMIRGNLQWMSHFTPLAWNTNREVFTLCLRRAFRLIWAWWVLTGLCFAVVIVRPPTEILFPVTFGAGGLVFLLRNRDGVASFLGSLLFFREFTKFSRVKSGQEEASRWR